MSFFTVIIPTCNRAALVKDAIQSVLDQTYKDFELIVVDDYSTDNTKEVVELFDDERIEYVVNDRMKGGAGTRNAGISRAKGEWIAFIDDDDVWLPRKLELTYEKIQTVDHSVGLIYTGHAVYDFDKKNEISRYEPIKKGWIQNDLLYANYVETFSTVTIRRIVLDSVKGLDERFKAMQDMELYIRIAGTYKIEFIKEKLAHIRRSNTDRISVNTEKKLESALLFYEKYYDLIIKNPKSRHHISSMMFIYALKQKRWNILFKVLPWTLAGLFFDFNNFLKTLWAISLVISKRYSMN